MRYSIFALAALLGTAVLAAASSNLARTSLATVAVSSVHGDRDPGDAEYGALNLFDEGKHLVNRVRYTSWQSGGEASPWVEVRFVVPVTVTAIHLEDGLEAERDRWEKKGRLYEQNIPPAPPLSYTVAFTLAQGAGPTLEAKAGTLVLPKPVEQVVACKFVFPPRQGKNTAIAPLRVEEIGILGFPPATTQYEVGPPHLAFSEAGALLAAQGAFTVWLATLGKDAAPRTEDKGNILLVTYAKDGLDLCRVTIDKQTAKVLTVEPLVKLAPVK